MGKIVLMDLDGTLTNTAHPSFKAQKDGVTETILSQIPIMPGAIEFVNKLKELGHFPSIISDSHPKYVNPISERFFQIPALSLADKPNCQKTKEFVEKRWKISSYADQCLMIGDTWLDIELGRSLNCPTILSLFYRTNVIDERDGIGQDLKNTKSGPTYIVNDFKRVLEILTEPIKYLLAAEAIFHNVKSKQSRKIYSDVSRNSIIALRSLGRQNAGDCDPYGIANKYFEFQRNDRSLNTVKLLSKAVDNYLFHVIDNTQDFTWDILTYISDKKTTIPPNKMKQLHEILEVPIKKEKLFLWKDDIEGSIRSQKNYQERNSFVTDNVIIDSQFDLKGKNVIVIDDQLTTGGTAFAIKNILKQKGALNILFVTLFYMISNVENEKSCPKCGKRLIVKIRRSDGNRFLSCTLPKYGGNGCGYLENIT